MKMNRVIIEGKENFKQQLKYYEDQQPHSYWSEMQQMGYIEIKSEGPTWYQLNQTKEMN